MIVVGCLLVRMMRLKKGRGGGLANHLVVVSEGVTQRMVPSQAILRGRRCRIIGVTQETIHVDSIGPFEDEGGGGHQVSLDGVLHPVSVSANDQMDLMVRDSERRRTLMLIKTAGQEPRR